MFTDTITQYFYFFLNFFGYNLKESCLYAITRDESNFVISKMLEEKESNKVIKVILDF